MARRGNFFSNTLKNLILPAPRPGVDQVARLLTLINTLKRSIAIDPTSRLPRHLLNISISVRQRRLKRRAILVIIISNQSNINELLRRINIIINIVPIEITSRITYHRKIALITSLISLIFNINARPLDSCWLISVAQDIMGTKIAIPLITCQSLQ